MYWNIRSAFLNLVAYLFAIANQALPFRAIAVVILSGELQISIIVALVLLITIEIILMTI